MKFKPTGYATIVSCALASIIMAGCAQQQQQQGRYHPTPATAPAPAPQRAGELRTTSSGYCPDFATFEENGVRWIRGSMGFPTGLRDSSGLLIEKTVPAEVLAGQQFDYAYKVSNLLDCPIQNVVVYDRVTPNFSAAQSDPQPTGTREGVASWDLGHFGPKETKTIHVKGSSADEGTITTCGWATYLPVLCEDVKVVKANIQLVKAAPAEGRHCDP